MESLKIYEINANYIDYLLPFAPHLFHNSKKAAAPPVVFLFCAEKRHRPKTVPFCHFLRNVQ